MAASCTLIASPCPRFDPQAFLSQYRIMLTWIKASGVHASPPCSGRPDQTMPLCGRGHGQNNVADLEGLLNC